MAYMGSANSSQRRGTSELECEVSFGGEKFDLRCPASISCGEFRAMVAAATSVGVEHQRLIHRGKEIPASDQPLADFGLRARGNRFALRHNELFYRTEGAITALARQVDDLEGQFRALGQAVQECEATAARGEDDSESVARRHKLFVVVNESATQMLIKLDALEVDGDLRAQRKAQVQRVIALADQLDRLKGVCVAPAVAR